MIRRWYGEQGGNGEASYKNSSLVIISKGKPHLSIFEEIPDSILSLISISLSSNSWRSRAKANKHSIIIHLEVYFHGNLVVTMLDI